MVNPCPAGLCRGCEILHRSRNRCFDLVDHCGPYAAKKWRRVLFGIRTDSPGWKTWTERRLCGVEAWIEADFGYDYGFRAAHRRLRGLGLPCQSEALWELRILNFA